MGEAMELFQTIGDSLNISPYLLYAIALVESALNPLAVSPAGASGIMQIMPQTWEEFGEGDIFNPYDNIMAGGKYLRWCWSYMARKGKGELAWALACYVCGPGCAGKASGFDDLSDEVKKYVLRVERLAREMEERIESNVEGNEQTTLRAYSKPELFSSHLVSLQHPSSSRPGRPSPLPFPPLAGPSSRE